jgi:hypothetical protein
MNNDLLKYLDNILLNKSKYSDNNLLKYSDNNLLKHQKYKYEYSSNEIYWGLGIENELYLEFEMKKKINKDFFIKNHKSERYSVDYFSNYNKNILKNTFNYIDNNIIKDEEIEINLLMNAYSFINTDKNNNHKTLFTNKSETNILFNNFTIMELLLETNNYFKETLDINWILDGDTIEITTHKFYKSNLNNILNELYNTKDEFIKNLNDSFDKLKVYNNDYGKIKFMEDNYPYAIYTTNLKNISMFNNGTLHYNLTLPTFLDKNSRILHIDQFIDTHKKAIRIIQWIEPLFIAIYGSPDPFSNLDNYIDKTKLSKSSQRCAISRYISIGTYDTDLMNTGKILTLNINDTEFNKLDYWWYNEYHKDSGYNKLDKIGLDINFNKHYNHGIELRFIDHIPDKNKLKESFEFIILLMDYILDDSTICNNILNPIKNKIWNIFVVNSLKYGKDYILIDEEKELYEYLFNVKFNNNELFNIYYQLFEYLKLKYCINDTYIGKYSKLVLNISTEYNNINETIHETNNETNNEINNEIKKKELNNNKNEKVYLEDNIHVKKNKYKYLCFLCNKKK